eukprot:CAMPEP_0175166296 /NCGR_PEP_ID=MMETSP0087-20121206/27618_1 /TAXON_ID=136419 /ORGANISM="Unknown Unknown, Strain D1" /LENGTH=496 /DNA_ID=CAMNT_0016455879 /DNA_START=71 /DNA_END=1561 /DNA_ORIENTATION=+
MTVTLYQAPSTSIFTDNELEAHTVSVPDYLSTVSVEQFCETLFQIPLAAGVVLFPGTELPIEGCTAYDQTGEKIYATSELQEGGKYYAVPKERNFVWPAHEEGHNVTLPYPLNNGQNIVLETLTTSPRLFRLHNFLSDSEVDEMLASANTLGYERSTGGLAQSDNSGKENQGVFTSRRTSENAWDLNSAISNTLKKRSFDVLRMQHVANREDGFQVVRYKPGQFYMSHTDYFDVNEDPYWNFDSYKGGSNRFATVFLYLSDSELGGETVFPKANRPKLNTTEEEEALVEVEKQKLFPNNKMAQEFVQECRDHFRVQPKKGDAVVFYHQDRTGKLDPAALHGACPVLRGFKWGANLWIWNDEVYNLETVESRKPEHEKDPKVRQFPVRFVNNGADDLSLWWVGHGNQLVAQGKIYSGDELTINSYHGHTFVSKLGSATETEGEALTEVTVHHTISDYFMEKGASNVVPPPETPRQVVDDFESPPDLEAPPLKPHEEL